MKLEKCAENVSFINFANLQMSLCVQVSTVLLELFTISLGETQSGLSHIFSVDYLLQSNYYTTIALI